MCGGLFAIIGVVLGSVSTYLVQNLMAGRAERFATTERRRREQMDVCSAFAANAMDARRGQINRWYQRREGGRGSGVYEEAKTDSYRVRSAARRERYRVQLVTSDQELTELAEAAVESLGDIHKADAKSEMEARAERTRILIEQFVRTAAMRMPAQDGRPTHS